MIIPAAYPLRFAQKGTVMPVKWYDEKGVERDQAWFVNKYGRIDVLLSGKTPNWDLVAVHETIGPALMKCLTLDENNVPAYCLAVLTWPELGNPSKDLPDLTRGNPAKSQWSNRGAAQFTDGQTGYTGWGLGSSSWVKDLNVGGPYHVFIFDSNTYSDCLSHVGWLGGTDHMGPCYVIFKKRLEAGPIDPGGNGGGDNTTVLAALNALDAKLTALMKHLGAV